MTQPNTNYSARKTWMVISWQLVDHLDGRYGKLLTFIEGTREQAEEAAREFVQNYKPIGIVEVIE